MTGAADVIYGIIAKTESGRLAVECELLEVLPESFPRQAENWWCNTREAVALYNPAHVEPQHGAVGSGSCIAAVGAVYTEKTASSVVNLADCEGRVALGNRLQRIGAKALSQLKGEFAIAFWDAARGELILARDHFGQRSLFIREENAFFIFCSELGPLLADPKFNCQLDIDSALHYLAFGTPAPGRTLAEKISSVPAAHYLTLAPERPAFSCRYYTPLNYRSEKIFGESFRRRMIESLDSAIGERTVENRQAILLSGGVDSSYIAATVARHDGADKLSAYTIEYTEGRHYNEAVYAAEFAHSLGIEHFAVPFEPEQVRDSFVNIMDAHQPCSAWTSVTHNHLLPYIRNQGHKHLISGLGADEVFGGYSKYLHHYTELRIHEEEWPLAGRMDAFAGAMWRNSDAQSKLFEGVPRFFDNEALQQGLGQAYRGWSYGSYLVEFYRQCRRSKSNAHLFEMMVAHECQHRIPDLLFAGFETQARRFGLRTAYPFLDPDIAALACGLGAAERFWFEGGMWRNKKALREIAALRLPESIIQRQPKCYDAPVLSWIADPIIFQRVRALLYDSPLWELDMITPQYRRLIEARVTAQVNCAKLSAMADFEQLWASITLAAWYNRWVVKKC